MNKNGRISLVTNYRDPANINAAAPSRGQLVSDFLISKESPQVYLQNVSKRASEYNGFNLLVGNQDGLMYLSNYKEGIQKLGIGIYGLSNHLLDTPWPKVKQGKDKFRKAIGHTIIEPDSLFELLYDEQQAKDEWLPDTGIGLERERALSSMFIKTNGYGTRCSTIILIDHQNNVLFFERTYQLDTFRYNTQSFQFRITE